MTETSAERTGSSTRDRLLLAAGQLLHESKNRDVSTRAICERAGVQAPTLYHYFGSKQGLLDAVVNHGFTQYMRDAAQGHDTDDPVAAIRAVWDNHVRFGLANPSFYVLVHGEIQPGVPCTLTATAVQLVLDLLNQAARAGRLRVAPEVAAHQFVAANVGVTLGLIATPGEPDFGWSTQLRDTILDAVLDDAPAARPAGSALSTVAVGFLAALDEDRGGLTDGETTLLREWLHRMAR
jgi:AcrR family transcriptional regulator